MRTLFFFLDGLGLAPATTDNPLVDAQMPWLHRLLGGPLSIEQVQRRDGLLLAPIDATLGVEGLPQSGTGQTTLLTGTNAAALHGRHQTAFPPVALRPLLLEQSVLRQAVERGHRVAFANVFPLSYWETPAVRRGRRSASVLAAQGAGLRFRTPDDLRRGEALAWDISGASLRAFLGPDIPLFAPEAAGNVLAHLANTHDLTFFECLLPDLAAHGRTVIGLTDALALIDACIGATVAGFSPDTTLVITSDHGNAESRAAPAHTRNPVPLLAVGPAAAMFGDVRDIAGVAGALLESISL